MASPSELPDVIGLPVSTALDRASAGGWQVSRCRLTAPDGDVDVTPRDGEQLRVVRQRRWEQGLEWLVAAAAPRPDAATSDPNIVEAHNDADAG